MKCQNPDCKRCNTEHTKPEPVLFYNELIEVKPMEIPASLLFHEDFRFTSSSK